MPLFRLLAVVLAALGATITLLPEAPVRLPANLEPRVIHGAPGVLHLSDVADRDASAPAVVMQRLVMYRAWTPERGVQPLELEFGPIAPTSFVGVAHQGLAGGPAPVNALYLRCSVNHRTKAVLAGGTNTTITETIVPIGPGWCPGGALYLRLVATSTEANLGASAPYASSALAYLKQTYLGLVGFFLAAFAVLGLIFFAGGLAVRRTRTGLDPALGGFLALGAASLAAFYAYAWTPLPAPALIVLPIACALIALVAALRDPDLLASVWRAQRGPLTAWLCVGTSAFTVLHLGSVGAGVWEPAYRFAPAIWSSDHTLPTLLAEAARIGTLPQDGLIGSWSLSDRPPLMAGAYLLFADLLRMLQINNEGGHLQPLALAAGGVATCSLWAAAFYWAVKRAAHRRPRVAIAIVTLLAVTPFALFNTVYTWPKLFAAAFSVAAAAYVFRLRAGRVRTVEACVFAALAAFALLSHASSAFFLAPVGVIFLADRLRRTPRALIAGLAVGLALLGGWAGFKAAVLPSDDPLAAYALTGRLELQPSRTLGARLVERYSALSPGAWLATKAEAGSYLLTPNPPQGPGSLERPAPAPAADLAGRLRYWDFYSLSLGNLALILLALAATRGAWLSRGEHREAAMAGRLLAASAGCLGLFLATTFLALFIHQFSYDALLAAGLAFAVLTTRIWGIVLLIILSGLYTLAVWVIAPLSQGLAVDGAAAVALLLFAALAARTLLSSTARSAGRRQAAGPILGLGVGLAGALLLSARPTALLLRQQEASAPPIGGYACTGYLDGAVRTSAGDWRLSGWAWDRTARAPVSSLRVIDDRGNSIGSAQLGDDRPDVPNAVGEVTTSRVGWRLDAATRPPDARAVAVLADGSDCLLKGGL